MFIHSYRRSVISSVQMYQVYSISLSASTEVQQKWGFPDVATTCHTHFSHQDTPSSWILLYKLGQFLCKG